MFLHILVYSGVSFTLVEAKANVFNDEIENQQQTTERFKEIYEVLRHQSREIMEQGEKIRHQSIQIMEQSEKIRILENEIHIQKERYESQKHQLKTLQDDMRTRTKQIMSLETIVDRQKKEIFYVRNNLSEMNSSQTYCETNVLKLNELISDIRTGQHKQGIDHGVNFRSSNVKFTPFVSESITESHKMNNKGRRLLEGTLPTISSTSMLNTPTAFYAYLSHGEGELSTHSTVIFDIVKTNYNVGYSPFSGVFTVPVSGVYGFTYTIRMSCRNDNAHTATLELIKNSEVEAAIFLEDSTCLRQVTVSTTSVIHASQGDNVFIRTHPSSPMNANVVSDGSGKSSFAGWLINSD